MGRPLGKQKQITDWLRTEIVRGRFAPGDRLPTREAVVRRFRAGPVTVQAAFSQLARCGFVRSSPPNGSFVADHPPHRYQYAVAFFGHPGDASRPNLWSTFYEALALAAQRETVAGPRRVRVFYDVNGHADSDGYRDLVRLVRQNCLAGVLFAASPHDLIGTELLSRADLPRVAVMPRPWELSLGVPHAVALDDRGLLRRAMGFLAARGRKRLACLMRSIATPGGPGDRFRTDMVRFLRQSAAHAGLELAPYHIQFLDPHDGDGVRRCTHLLFHADGSRPDALLLGDDHLLASAQAGLADAGAVVGRDVEVASHWNYPLAPPRTMPSVLLGYDAQTVLTRAIEMIDLARDGRSAPTRRLVPAVSQDEWFASRQADDAATSRPRASRVRR